jgi:hypothetical protein
MKGTATAVYCAVQKLASVGSAKQTVRIVYLPWSGA